MKKRHLKAISAEERGIIAREYYQDHALMADVGSKHHISAGLVGRICKDYKRGGQQITKRR